MKSLSITTAILIVTALGFSGCQTPTSTASANQLQKSYVREHGTILVVKEIVIDESSGEHEGALFGAFLGGVEGADEDGLEGAIVGAVAGAIIGEVVENVANTTKAYELVIQRESGGKIVVLQRQQTLKGIQPNDPVVILTDVQGNTIIQRV